MKDLNSTQARVTAARTKGDEQQGFTLIETVIAMVLMMITGLGAASLFFYAVNSNSRGRDRELSMAVAQRQMEILRNAKFADLDTVVTASGGANKTVSSGNRQYNVVTTVAQTVTGDAARKTITVTVTPRGATGAAAITQVFGGVTLVTQRSTHELGPYL